MKPHLDHPPPKAPHWDWVDKWKNHWEYDPCTNEWRPSGSHKNNPNKPQPLFPPGTLKTLAVVGGTVGAGYLIYRGVRILPSLFPPLWWTIPENLAFP